MSLEQTPKGEFLNAPRAAGYVSTQVIIPGKNAVQAFGINDKGQLAVTTDDGTTGIYDHGTYTSLPPPLPSCGCAVTAVAVNDSGVVVGIAFPSGGGRGMGVLPSR